jgi:putative hydrolase of the HAD superfamily
MRDWRVIFDLGGVLVDWNPEAIVAGFYADRVLGERMLEAVFRHPDWLALDQGLLDDQSAIARMAARTGRPRRELDALLLATRRSLQPLPASWALLHELHAMGVPLYALSNMAEGTWRHLQANVPGWALFNGVLISAHERLLKPMPEIFQLMLRRYRLEPTRTVFIDDVGGNVAAAVASGMHGIVFRNAADCAMCLAAISAGELAVAGGGT